MADPRPLFDGDNRELESRLREFGAMSPMDIEDVFYALFDILVDITLRLHKLEETKDDPTTR